MLYFYDIYHDTKADDFTISVACAYDLTVDQLYDFIGTMELFT